jgi:hypothetical protein
MGKLIPYSTAALLALLAAAIKASAADLSINHDRDFIRINGELTLADINVFRGLAAAVPKTQRGIVSLSSPGGQVLAGIRIGELIRQRNFVTMVANKMTCTSSCAIAWLGGVPRISSTTANIGFHGAYEANSGDASSMGNAVLGAYLSKLGLSELAIAYISYANPNEMQWLSADDAVKLGIALYIGECPENGDCMYTSTLTGKTTVRPIQPLAPPRPATSQPVAKQPPANSRPYPASGR